MVVADDFIMTLDSGDEVDVDELPVPKKKTVKGKIVDESLNPDFTFDLSGDPYVDLFNLENTDEVKIGSKPVRPTVLITLNNTESVLGASFGG